MGEEGGGGREAEGLEEVRREAEGLEEEPARAMPEAGLPPPATFPAEGAPTPPRSSVGKALASLERVRCI